MMKKKFATNLLLLLALNLLVKPFWIFGIDRTVQNVVGAADYGIFFALLNFSLLLNILLDFGLTNYNNREISRHSQMLPRFFSNMLVIKLLLSIGYAIICFAFALIVGYSGRQLYLLSFLVLNQFLSSLILYLRSNISGLQMFRADSILSVTDRVLMIIFCSALLWGPVREGFHIEWFIYTQTISYLITASIAFAIVYSRSRGFRPKFDRGFLVSIIRQSYPYALLILLMSLYSRIDTVMLERILPDGDVQSGIYAQAFRLLDAVNMLPFLFAGLLLPMFSRMLKRNEPVRPLLGFAFSLLIATSFSIAVAGIVYRDPIMDALYVHHSEESSTVLGLLMVSFVFISVTYIFGTLLTANGSLKELNVISGIGVVANITLNAILIPKYQVVGAAISSLCTQFLMAILQAIAAFRTFRITIKPKHFLSFLIFIPGCIVLVIASQRLAHVWYYGFGVYTAGVILLVLVSRLIRLNELLQLVREKDSDKSGS